MALAEIARNQRGVSRRRNSLYKCRERDVSLCRKGSYFEIYHESRPNWSISRCESCSLIGQIPLSLPKSQVMPPSDSLLNSGEGWEDPHYPNTLTHSNRPAGLDRLGNDSRFRESIQIDARIVRNRFYRFGIDFKRADLLGYRGCL
jgi:hypothetical protein